MIYQKAPEPRTQNKGYRFPRGLFLSFFLLWHHPDTQPCVRWVYLMESLFWPYSPSWCRSTEQSKGAVSWRRWRRTPTALTRGQVNMRYTCISFPSTPQPPIVAWPKAQLFSLRGCYCVCLSRRVHTEAFRMSDAGMENASGLWSCLSCL